MVLRPPGTHLRRVPCCAQLPAESARIPPRTLPDDVPPGHTGLMRLWSLHPRLLDRQGLTACWREALLAQAVLAGRTRGYRNHPQLDRFRATADPIAAVGSYLAAIADEAEARGYRFDRTKIDASGGDGASVTHGGSVARDGTIPVTDGQLSFEWRHLASKLAVRSPAWLPDPGPGTPSHHPLFHVVAGHVEPWERV